MISPRLASRTVRRLIFACSILMACLSWAQVAGAESASPDAEARQHFLRGIQLYDAGDHSAALAEFVWANNLRPHFAILFNIAQCYTHLGRYADAIGQYETYLDRGGARLPAERRATVEAELERLRALFASVTITVDVAGATVLIDDQEVGTAPIEEPLRVRSGVHMVEARLEGYRSARLEITVAGGTTPPPVELHMEEIRREGHLRVESRAPGARVFIDGAEQGAVPWDGVLQSGEHVLEVRAPRYRTARREISIAVDAERTLTVELETEGRPARVQIISSEDGSEVFVEGRDAGETPMRPMYLPAGAYRFRVQREGFVPWEGDVSLQEGQGLTARVDLVSEDWGISQGWFWSTLGLTLATGVASIVTGFLALRSNEEAESYVAQVLEREIVESQSAITERYNEMLDEARQLALATDILWITATVSAVTSLVLAFFSRFRPPSSEVEIEIGGGVAEGSAMLSAGGRF